MYLNAALKTHGIWNSSQYSSQALDDAFAAFQAAPEKDDAGRATAAKTIQQILNDDTAVIIPYFYNWTMAANKRVTGYKASAIGTILGSFAIAAAMVRIASAILGAP